MTSSNAHPDILMVGLPATSSKIPEELHQKVADGLQHAYDTFAAAGLRCQHSTIEPEQLQQLEKALQERRWDGVIIGNGIRSNMQLTQFMEQIIEAAQRLAPQARILFNTSPEDSLDAVRRWFPSIPHSK